MPSLTKNKVNKRLSRLLLKYHPANEYENDWSFIYALWLFPKPNICVLYSVVQKYTDINVFSAAQCAKKTGF